MNATYVSVLSQSILDNSPGGASLLHPNAAAALGTPGLAALLVAYILPVCALLAPCHPGAALRDLCNESLLRDTRSSDPSILKSLDPWILRFLNPRIPVLPSRSPMPLPAIEFRDVSFARPGRPRILDHFSLLVEAGDVLALVGRSGASKTT